MITLNQLLKEKLEYRGSYINGHWQLPLKASGEWELVSPANLDWHLPRISFQFEHIEQATEAAIRAWPLWKNKGVQARIEHLKRFGEELSKRSELIAKVISLETGKPFQEAQAEALLLKKKIEVTLEEALPLVAQRELVLDGNNTKGSISYHSKGVLAVLGPFNFPVHLSHGHLIPALLVGNTCILKPSERTPLSAQIYIEAAQAAELPPGVLQLVQGNGELGMRLVRHNLVSGVLATCSLDVGTKIRQALADNPRKLIALEMGGKNSALVCKGADLDRTAKDLMTSSFLTTGQRCTALSRVYVQRQIADELISKVHALAKDLIVAQPFHENPLPFMGPLISSQSKDKFLRYSEIAEAENAEAIMRPKSLEGVPRKMTTPLPLGHYVTPSLYKVQKHDPSSAYQSHEIFGPDMFFCTVEDEEQGIACINDSKYGLVSAVFGVNEERFHSIADQIECGLVYLNRPSVGASGRLPFGGWKNSGNHRPAGVFAIYASTQVQSRIY